MKYGKTKLFLLVFLLFTFGNCGHKSQEKGPSQYDMLVTNGKGYLSKEDFEHAASAFEKAIKLEPQKPEGHYGRMLSYTGLVVHKLNAIVKLMAGLQSSPSFFVYSNFKRAGVFDIKSMLKDYLSSIQEYAEKVTEETDFLEKFEYVSFYIKHLPLHFDTSVLLGEEVREKLGNTDYLDLGGQWGLVELYWIGGAARFILGVLDLIYAHDFRINNMPTMNFEKGFEVFLVKLLLDNPNLLGPDPNPEEARKLFKVGPLWGDAFIQWADIMEEANVELKHDPDQSNNVVPIYDTNKNGVYDPGDGIGLYKLLPVGLNPDFANLFRQVYFSESMGKKVANTLFKDWENFLRNVGLSLKGELKRNLSIKQDLNPLLQDLNEKPMDNILELNLHALFDKEKLEYLRDLLPYIYYDDKVRKAYVFVVEHNDPYMTVQEIVNYAQQQTSFAGRVTYATPGTNPIWHDVFCLVDQPHFDVENNPFYQDVKGLEKIPPDCLIDVDQKIIYITYPEKTTVPDHPSLTYIAFKDPTFSGLGCINLDEWKKPDDYFKGIPDPYIPPDLRGKGCQPPTQYSLNALFQYFILYFEGQEVEIFGLDINQIFNRYHKLLSFSPMRKQ